MRRRSVLLALPAGLLTLAACGDDGGEGDGGSTSLPTGKEVKATGKIVDGPLPEITEGREFGQKPTIAKGEGDPSGDIAVQVVVAGTGAKVAEGDLLQVDYLGQKWDTAEVFDNSFDRGKPSVFPIGERFLIPAWDQVMVGQQVGSRVLMAVPPQFGYGEQGDPSGTIKGDDTLVFVMDVHDTFNASSSAKGKRAAQDDAALPKIGTNTDGKAPAIEVPKAAPPKELVSAYVLEGDGPEVTESDGVVVQYKGVLWDGGKEFDSTYARGEITQFGLGQVIQGWAQGLTGQKVGSRVMIVVPPELGYGEEGTDGIPGGATIVFSVDILAVTAV
ncbi:FKBP-type peptidyl-prolyl cis-trans isomerase [Streptomyces sp. JJ66]|uniref:FKBP-type peptidyl-prolyl cis-trans isomerase n=1 Tax=Streptomyces sp. JJ66 TaxID=2803843 RepID=UPI001C579ADB|nr:FKBP-type peptidyl-prolyl cis-trans isomerase [Streptomyces sp. JJ66]MBW1602149.1 FKBP-type peptidyl-prolyl cis-trans isomerase [Streptomyces sp. JJ66]